MTADRDLSVPVEELIIESAKRAYPRLPMLEVIFDRFVLSLPQVLKAFLASVADVRLLSMEYLSCQEAVDGLPDFSLTGVVEASGWDGDAAVVLSSELLFLVIEITFGGRTVAEGRCQERSLTMIEKNVGRSLIETVLGDLSVAFEKVSPTRFRVSGLETNRHALLLAPPSSSCVRVTLEVEAEGRRGRMVILLPNTSFEPVQHILGQAFTGGQLGGNHSWRQRIGQRLGGTSVEVDAVMARAQVPLRSVLGWQPGTLLDFDMMAEDPVTLVARGMTLAQAEVGKRPNGRIALQLVDALEDHAGKEEETNDLRTH